MKILIFCVIIFAHPFILIHRMTSTMSCSRYYDESVFDVQYFSAICYEKIIKQAFMLSFLIMEWQQPMFAELTF